MSSIKDGDTKLTIAQVCDRLAQKIPESSATKIMTKMEKYEFILNPAERFAHAALDAYILLPTETDEDMEIRKLCKHLTEKYMKSENSKTTESQHAYGSLIKELEGKASVS